MNIIGIALDELYRIFGILNTKYYDAKLPEPVITIQRSNRGGALGWFTLNKVWASKDPEPEAFHEINVSAEHLSGDVYDIVETLQHEMVHYANHINEIKDCTNQVHNKKFKALAEKVGLICERSKKYGWGYTSVSDDFRGFIDSVVKPNAAAFSHFRKPVVTPPKETKKTIFKYTCPQCDLEVKAKADKDIVCGACQCELVMEDE
jgi:predicted SprT family Zn-dependent metalloprotease